MREPTLSVVQRRLFLNSATMMACRLASIAAALIAIPIILKTLGMTAYGVWEAIFAFSTLSAVFQTPMSGTLIWLISRSFGENDLAEIRRLVRIGIGGAMLLAALVVPIVWWMSSSIIRLFHIPFPFFQTAKEMLPVLVALSLLGGMNECFGAALSGCQRAGVTALMQTMGQFANNSIVIAMLLLTGSFWSLAAGAFVGFAITAAGLYFFACRICGTFSIVPLLPRQADLKAWWRYAGFLLVGSASTVLRGQTDRLILASFASPIWTGYYGIASRMAGAIMEASNLFYVPTIAAAGALHARLDWQGIRQLFLKISAVVCLVAGMAILIIGGLYDRLEVLWLGKVIPETAPILYLLLLGNSFAVILTGPGTAICKGIGQAGIETVYVASGLILNLVLTITLVAWIGAMGTVVASAVSWTVTCLLFVFILHRVLDLPLKATLSSGWSLICLILTVVGLRIFAPALPLAASRMEALWSICRLAPIISAVYFLGLLTFRMLPLPKSFGIPLEDRFPKAETVA